MCDAVTTAAGCAAAITIVTVHVDDDMASSIMHLNHLRFVGMGLSTTMVHTLPDFPP